MGATAVPPVATWRVCTTQAGSIGSVFAPPLTVGLAGTSPALAKRTWVVVPMSWPGVWKVMPPRWPTPKALPPRVSGPLRFRVRLVEVVRLSWKMPPCAVTAPRSTVAAAPVAPFTW